ncbi:MAG: PA14 domain-containing protein [Verrucomicrobiota bacterium]
MKQTQPFNRRAIACLLGIGALAGTAKAGQVTYDFTTDPKTGANPLQIVQAGFADSTGESIYWKAAGGNPGGFLGITWPIGSSTTIAVFPDIDAGKVITAFTLETDLRIGSPQQNERPADGFSINFARNSDPVFETTDASSFATSGAVETGTKTGIAICFDTWAGNALPDGADIEGIIVRVDNVTVLRQAMPTRNGACADNTSLQTGPRPVDYWTAAVNDGTLPDAAFVEASWTNLCWQPLKVELDPTAKLSVTYKGRLLLDKYQTTFFPSAGKIVLAGRTGNADEHTHFDNLKLSTTVTSDSAPPTAPTNLKVDATTAGKVALSWTAATDDSGLVGYNLERDGTVIKQFLNSNSYIDLAVQPGKTYAYKVQAIDPAGNKSAFTAAVNATTPAAAPTTIPGLTFEAWLNIDGTPVSNLTDNDRYIANTPDVKGVANGANTRSVFYDDSHDNYGGRLSGLLTPTESGDYEFFLRSDDASQLFISTDANAANLVQIAEETGCCAAFQESGDPRTSAPVALQAGKSYAFQVLWKEGGGGDYAQVAWRKSGDKTAAASLAPIPARFFTTSFDLSVGLPLITNKTVTFSAPGQDAVLSLGVAGGDKPITYEWKPFGGAVLAGETNASLTLKSVNLTNVGRVYTVTAKNAFGSIDQNFAAIPNGTLFVEAEDFNFDGGHWLTNGNIGMTGRYGGGAYQNLGTETDAGIDWNSDGGGAQTFRDATGVDVDKVNQHADGLPRGDFDVIVNAVVGWNDAGEWENYTRQFPATATDYNVIGRLASGGNNIHIQMDEITAGVTTSSATLSKLGEFNPGRATPGWDNMEFFPLVDTNGAPAVVKGWNGLKSFRMTMLPGSAEDMDYFMFIPATGAPPTGNVFTSAARNGNNLVLTFSGGTLEQADAITGPWTAVNPGTSPATVAIGGGQKFFRLR